MVKVKNPFAGIDASGKLADVLAFASTKQGVVAGKKRIPKQPRTGPQLATRYYMRWLANQWAQLTIAELASWSSAPGSANLPSYNAFIKYNVNRFKHLPGDQYWVWDYENYPSAAYPATMATAAADFASPLVTVGPAEFTITFNPTPINDNWLFAVHQQTADHPLPVYRNLLDAWPVLTSGVQSHTVSPAPIGSYLIFIISLSRTGKSRKHYRSKTVNVPAS